MPLDLNKARKCLADFDFSKLFIEELGWSQPASRQTVPMTYKDAGFTRRQLAQLAGVMVLEVTAQDGRIPDAKTRAALHKEISALHHENLLIFVDERRTQSLWYWVKRQDGKTSARDHIFVRGQPGDLFLSKLNSMVFDISDFDEAGNVPLVEVADRLKEALDIERVTKKFYTEFQDQHLEFLNLIKGIDDERDRRWYASVLLNRLMFIYFLQRKFFLDGGDGRYLQNRLEQSADQGKDLYYEKFLKVLFFEGFAKPEEKRSAKVNALLGKIKYLNGGLFLHHRIELKWSDISVPDKAFANLFALFERYSWNLNDTPGGQDDEINPDVLGYIFEKYINQKAFGAYYTRPEITEYLCERTIHRLILDGVANGGGKAAKSFESMGDLLLGLDAHLCKKLLNEVLPNLRLLDPACGSAAFLVSAMKTLINVYSAVIGKIEFLSDRGLQDWLKKTQKEHKSVSYFIKRSIITNNLFGVDIMEEAVEIAKLRLFLALVASANSVDDLEPLPNIEFNVMTGNSLIGLLQVDEKDFDKYAHDLATKAMFKDYREVLEEKNHLIGLYRRATAYAEDIQSLRDGIEAKKQKAIGTLNRLLLDQFQNLGINYEQATWDEKKNASGKTKKRALTEGDIVALKPFHWGFEFDEIINQRGGFDAIITNPPWEVFEASEKEFFQEYVPEIQKKALRIEDWQKQFKTIMKREALRSAWLSYVSGFSHASTYLRSAPQYTNQQSFDSDGRRLASKINLYKVFLEQCVNLLRSDGYCGMVIPSGIYNELGAKQLREMLFAKTTLTGLFGFDNRKEIFEGVHRSFKFVALTLRKSGSTHELPVVFMRADVSDLARFPAENALWVSVDLIRRLSPESLSILEFKGETDVGIAEKMLRFPLLGEERTESWTIRLAQEINMTSDNRLFSTNPAAGLRPLFEGKMIWQFESHFSEPRYWVDVEKTRRAVLGKTRDEGQVLAYQTYRLVFRAVGENTNERNMIATVLPPLSFCGHSIIVTANVLAKESYPLYLCGVLNSFVVDYALRMKMTRNVSMFHIYQMPLPRLTEKDADFWPIVNRAARLICTAREFDGLAKKVGLKGQKDGATDAVERGKLRAELDGLIAHLYGLTEDEFAYILTTFPLVADPVKIAAHNAFRNVEKGLIK